METFAFHYGHYLKKVSKVYYFQVLKNRMSLVIGALILMASVAVMLLAQSLLYGGLTALVVVALGLELATYLVIKPNRRLKDPRINAEYHVAFDEEHLALESKGAQSKVAWDHFVKVWENGEFYLLFHNKKQFWFVPKEAFQNREQEQKFRQTVLKHHKITSGLIRS